MLNENTCFFVKLKGKVNMMLDFIYFYLTLDLNSIFDVLQYDQLDRFSLEESCGIY